MRGLFLRLGAALLLVVAVSHAVSLARVFGRFDDDRREVARRITEEAADRLVERLGQGPVPPPPGLDRLAAREGLDVHVEPRGHPPPPPHHGPGRRGPPEARRTLPDGRELVAHLALAGPPPVGPLDLAAQVALVLAVVGVATWWLARPVARDLGRLEGAVGRLGGEDLAARVGPVGTTPLRPLGDGLDRMAERIERLVVGQRQVVQAVSHDLRTPHARLRFRLDALADADDPATRARLRDDVERDLERVDELLEELLTYLKVDAEPAPPDEAPWSAAASVEAVVERLPPVEGDVDVVLHLDADVRVAAPRRWFERAVENLLVNARRHARSRVVVTLRVDGDGVVLDVDDDGPGIPVAERARVVEPFVRGDATRSVDTGGTGLGLAIVARTLERVGGALELGDAELGGLRARTTWGRG